LLTGVLVFIGPIMGAIGAILGISILGPVLLVGAGVAALILILMQIPGVAGPLEDVFGSLLSGVMSLIGPIMDVGKAILNLFTGKGSAAQIGTALGGLGGAVEKVGADLAPKLAKLGQALVSWVVAAAPKVVAALLDIVPKIAAWAVNMYIQLWTAVAKLEVALWTWVAKALPGIVKELTKIGVAIIKWVADMFPKAVKALMQLEVAFWTWVDQVLPVVLPKLVALLEGIISWLLDDGIPMLANAASTLFDAISVALPPMLQQLLELFAEYFPQIVSKVGEALLDIGKAVVQFIIWYAPQIVSHLIAWGEAFVGWVAERIPGLLASLGGLLGELVGWIINIGLPALLTQLGQWGGAFLGWIVPVITSLPGKLGDVIGAVVTWIISAAPQIGASMLGWAGQALGWIMSLNSSLPGRLAGITATIVSWVVKTGPTLVTDFAAFAVKGVEWIATLVTSLPGKLADIITGIATWVTTNTPTLAKKFGDMATSIGKSFANAAATLFVDAINGLIGAMDAVKFNIKYTFPSLDLGPLGKVGGQTVGFSWAGLGLGKLPIPSFAVGALNIPSDTLAMVHKGEMIVPAASAQGLRNLGGNGGSGQSIVHHTHIHLDGREIANIVDQYQGTRLLLSGSSRARPTGV
jgi:hypothetical protein